MPTSSSVNSLDKKKVTKFLNQKCVEPNEVCKEATSSREVEKNLLKIGPAFPIKDRRCLYVRSQSTLNSSSIAKIQDSAFYNSITLHPSSDGRVRVSRTQNEKETHPDRISLDRRALTEIPIIEGESKLRLLSLQHNLISDLESLVNQKFPTLVFLDIYDNQLQEIKYLDCLENLRVLLMGKNRIKKIEGLEHLQKLEVLDLHGNLIGQVGGLSNLSELKVLNLAGNQIRMIGQKDLHGLIALQELNLRRNRLKKILGFMDTPNLSKLFMSNNDIQSIDGISSIVKSQNIKEISIDNNPLSLAGDCVSFLVSYLPNLIKLNSMQITEQVKKTAMAWRRNKEATNAAFMDLTSEASMSFKREEVISNARTNWELLRSQTKCLTSSVNAVNKTLKNLKPDSDFILTSLISNKPNLKPSKIAPKVKPYVKLAPKVPLLPKKKFTPLKTPSQETETSQNTSSSNTSSSDVIKLPPILVPIISKLEQKDCREESTKLSESLSSIGPNIDSSSSLASGSDVAHSNSSSSSSDHSESESEKDNVKISDKIAKDDELSLSGKNRTGLNVEPQNTSSWSGSNSNNNEETSSNISVNTNISNSILSVPSTSSNENVNIKSNASIRNIKSAVNGRSPLPRSIHPRASTAKTRKTNSPVLPKDREQGSDYLIEICGRHLNIYGQGALRFIDKPWNTAKANDVTTVQFNYVNFTSISGFLSKVKHRFPNVEHFVFKETNINCLGQLNSLAEVQGLTALTIDPEGNLICQKEWRSYAIYRLAHWGLKIINDLEISNEDIKAANNEYQSLSDLVLWSLPDVLLQPLLTRLRIDINHGVTEENAKKWILSADPELRSVVSKEALQWKKGSISQDDIVMRQKGKQYISDLLEDMSNAMNKLRILDQEWPSIMHEFVQNTLLDYSHLDMYMKQKIQELNK